MPAVTVVVPVRDGAATLRRCLDGLAAQTLDERSLEVVVVDNGSTDGSAALAAAHDRVDRVVHEAQPGSYAARNAGIRVARGDVLAFTDADCRPDPDWLAEGLIALDGVHAVGGHVEPVLPAAPNPWARYDAALYLDQAAHVARDGFAATANLLLRREVVQRVGPFDAHLRSGGDVEMGHRLRHAGFVLAHAPRAVVHHDVRTTARGTWALHRRLGAGWTDLARRGLHRPGLRDPAVWLPLGAVVDAVAARAGTGDGTADGTADGEPAHVGTAGAPGVLRRRHLAPVHGLATLARVTGKLRG